MSAAHRALLTLARRHGGGGGAHASTVAFNLRDAAAPGARTAIAAGVARLDDMLRQRREINHQPKDKNHV